MVLAEAVSANFVTALSIWLTPDTFGTSPVF
jgi:hypothetical protein